MISKGDKDIIAPCLWGADMDSMDMEGDKFLIIERVLEHGGDKQVRFILDHYTSEDIVRVVKESSYLSPRTVNYWCLYFKLERGKTKCYMKPSRDLWPPLKPPVINPDYSVELASPEDISAMKVVAIIQRGIAKDFVDLKGLITAYEISLDYLISMIRAKYGVSEEYAYQIKKGLIYFDDAINNLGDVALIRDGKKVRMSNQEWKEVEVFLKILF